jgi:hypothetical protein
MTTSYSAFGVVRGDLSRYVHRMKFSDQTSPTDTQADEIIAERAAEWCQFLDSLGIDYTEAAGTSTDRTYLMSRRWIALAAACDCIRGRERDATELILNMQEELDRIKTSVRQRVSEVAGTGRATANRATSSVAQAANIATDSEGWTLGRRLANTGGV